MKIYYFIMNCSKQTVLETIIDTFNVSKADAEHIIFAYGNHINNDDHVSKHSVFIENIRNWFEKDFSHIREPKTNNIGILKIRPDSDQACIQGDIIHRYLALAEASADRKCAICYENSLAIISQNDEFVKLTCSRDNSSCFFCRKCITNWLTEFSCSCPVCKQTPMFHSHTKSICVSGDGTMRVYAKDSVVHRAHIGSPGRPPIEMINLPLP